jgi:ribonuclease HI
MDRDPNATCSGGIGVLDDVFQRVADEEQSWGETRLHLPLSVRMRYMIRIHFSASNIVVEYEALVNGLHIATELGIRWLDVRGDSQLIVDQVMKESSCHDPKMAAYCQVVHLLEDKFDGLELNHIVR